MYAFQCVTLIKGSVSQQCDKTLGKTSKPRSTSLQKKDLRRWLDEIFFLFLIHKLWRSALPPEKDRSDSHNSSLREVPCTHEAFHEGIPSYEVNYEINENQRKPIKKCQNAWIYKHPPTCKSPHEELNYGIVFGPSLAPARCAKVYE